MRVNYAIVFVSDMPRSVAFYRDVCGLPLKFDSPQWSEFATEGATPALHAWCVPDLDLFHARMIEQNVPCTQQPKDLFGARMAQYLDPDGLAISVSDERIGK